MVKLAVAIIHGVGSQQENFADDIINELKDRFSRGISFHSSILSGNCPGFCQCGSVLLLFSESNKICSNCKLQRFSFDVISRHNLNFFNFLFIT